MLLTLYAYVVFSLVDCWFSLARVVQTYSLFWAEPTDTLHELVVRRALWVNLATDADFSVLDTKVLLLL